MSECSEKFGPVVPALVISSMTIALNRKSPPMPPYSVGILAHSNPALPALQPGVAGNDAGLLPFGMVRHQFLGDEAANGGAEDLMLFGKQFARDHGRFLSWLFFM